MSLTQVGCIISTPILTQGPGGPSSEAAASKRLTQAHSLHLRCRLRSIMYPDGPGRGCCTLGSGGCLYVSISDQPLFCCLSLLLAC